MPRSRRTGVQRKPASVTDPLLEALGDARGAERVIRFFERVLIHAKGALAGQPFRLLPFQKDFIRAVYDPSSADGRRRIREALLMLPRKNGKTQLSAGLGLYATYCGEMGGQVAVAANSRDQAALLFGAACDMIEMSPILKARTRVSRAQKRLQDTVSRSTFKALSADAGTNHGLDLVAWIYDELHAAPNAELLHTLRTSTGARREPLGIVISTAGFDLQTPLGELYQHAKRWQADPTIDPHFHASLYEADPTDDWTEERTWAKANPALDAFRDRDEMRQLCERAKQVPSLADAFRRLYLNCWTQAESSWLDMAAWDACGDAVDDDELVDCEGFAGLDLSANVDLTALMILFRVGEKIAVRSFAWVPAEGLRDRELRDRVPYKRWANEGLLELIDGPVIDPRIVAARAIEHCRRYRVRRVCFDRWGSAFVVKELESAGLEVAEFGQGFASMSAPTKELQNWILQGRLAHANNPLLRWQASCCTVKSDPAGNVKIVKPDRLKHAKRVDSMVAMVMAAAQLMKDVDTSRSIAHWLENPLFV